LQRLAKTIGIGLTATLLFVGVAAAAGLGINTGKLSADNVAVRGCTSSALTATRDVDNSGNVTQVDVLGVPQACSGQELALTLWGSGGMSLGSASATIGACAGGCSVTFSSFGATVSAASLRGYAVEVSP
jgi:hypothetical protein